MEFPPEWSVFPAADFELAAARNPLERGVELLAQVRPNGRVIDHVRLVLGGSELIEAKVPFNLLFNLGEIPEWVFIYSIWPHSVKIKRNMVCSEWIDIRDIIAANDGRVELEGGVRVENKEVLDWMDKVADRTACSSSVRWAVTVQEDGNLQLLLQGIPAPATSFTGKPSFRG